MMQPTTSAHRGRRDDDDRLAALQEDRRLAGFTEREIAEIVRMEDELKANAHATAGTH